MPALWLALLPLLASSSEAPVQRGGADVRTREFNPKLLDGLRISRRRVAPKNVVRDWVLPKVVGVPKVPLVKIETFYTGLDAEMVSTTRRARLAIEDQGARGTCTIFATKFLAEYEIARQAKFRSATRLNPEYLNWAANAATNTSGDGSSFPAVVTGLGEYGCTAWSEPKVYDGKIASFDPKYTPSAEIQGKGKEIGKQAALLVIFEHSNPVMSDAEMDAVTSLLDAGIPVGVGQQWPKKDMWQSIKVGERTILDGLGATQGAHTMAIVGYKRDPKAPGGGFFLFRNSWGTDWGTEGYHFMSFNWVKNHTYDGCIALPPNWLG